MKFWKVIAAALAFVVTSASAQFSIGDGKPVITPRAAQTGLMSGRGVFTDPATITPYQMNGYTGPRVSTTCVGTIAYCTSQPTPSILVPTYTTGTGVTLSNGSFRLACNFVRAAYVDPVVFPANKLGSSHLHGFYGNTNVTPYSTHASLLAGGSSSCLGGNLNSSGYWFPMIVAHCPAGSTNGCLSVFSARGIKDGHVYVPQVNIYYKQERGQDSDTGSYGGTPMQFVPPGLIMIAGSPSATTNAAFSGSNDGYRWYCFNHAGADTGPLDHIPNAADITAIGSCSQTSPGTGSTDFADLKVVVGFPYCWDGVNLDSPGTHNAHVTYPGNVTNCPAAFPILLPQVELQLHWQIPDNVIPFLRLSSDPPASSGQPAGYTMHADYMEAWQQNTPQALLGGLSIENVLQTQCYAKGYAALNAGAHEHIDCHNNLLGNPDTANPTHWLGMY